jgi:hypothetical protein
LSESGVDEIACLIDFGVGFENVMDSLQRLSVLTGSNYSSLTSEVLVRA